MSGPLHDKIGAETPRDWAYVAMLAALTDFLLFALVGFPLAIWLDSQWPALVIIAPTVIGMVVAIVVLLVNEWRQVLRR